MERGSSRKKQKTPSAELDVEKFLFQLRGSVVMNDEETQFNRVVNSMKNGYYQTILARAWCVWRMSESGMSIDDMAGILGTNQKSSSYLQDAKKMYKLIVVYKMWKLRFLQPTPEQLKTLICSMKSFKKYFKDHTDPFWQITEEIPRDYNEWVKK
jgi:hypothetical protein